MQGHLCCCSLVFTDTVSAKPRADPPGLAEDVAACARGDGIRPESECYSPGWSEFEQLECSLLQLGLDSADGLMTGIPA